MNKEKQIWTYLVYRYLMGYSKPHFNTVKISQFLENSHIRIIPLFEQDSILFFHLMVQNEYFIIESTIFIVFIFDFQALKNCHRYTGT